MRKGTQLLMAIAFLVALVVNAVPAAAQTGRVGGTVKDDKGQPIKGATVIAENPNASPSSFTATTDDKGRYSIIGLRSGQWKITASAPGFQSFGGVVPIRTIGAPNPPVDFNLLPGAPAGPAGLPKEIVAEVEAAEAKFQAKDYDGAIAAYSALLAKAPKLTRLNVAIARSYRAKKDYKTAADWYQKAIGAETTDNSGRIELAMMQMEQGQLDAAREGLLSVAENVGATREVFYSLAEIERARDKADDAAKWYQRAADADATWAKPHVGLAMVAIQKGDIPAAIKHLEKASTTGTDPADQAVAKAMLDQLKK
jgi:Carboxypeptidase regulatory-like domain/Tetratricopeptide repeat